MQSIPRPWLRGTQAGPGGLLKFSEGRVVRTREKRAVGAGALNICGGAPRLVFSWGASMRKCLRRGKSLLKNQRDQPLKLTQGQGQCLFPLPAVGQTSESVGHQGKYSNAPCLAPCLAGGARSALTLQLLWTPRGGRKEGRRKLGNKENNEEGYCDKASPLRVYSTLVLN